MGLLISGLMCRLSITQTEKRCSAIDGGNGKAPSLFETIGGVTPTLRYSRLFSPVLRVPLKDRAFFIRVGSMVVTFPAGTHALGMAMDS